LGQNVVKRSLKRHGGSCNEHNVNGSTLWETCRKHDGRLWLFENFVAHCSFTFFSLRDTDIKIGMLITHKEKSNLHIKAYLNTFKIPVGCFWR